LCECELQTTVELTKGCMAMSKYKKLWQYIQSTNIQELQLTYSDIEKHCGVPIDHSFLTFKFLN
jgi:hypothetical protein